MKKLIFIMLFLFSIRIYSQCDCAAQSSGLNQLQLPEEKKDNLGSFRLSFLYKNIYGDKYYLGNNIKSEGMIKFFTVNYSNLLLNYYLNNNLIFFSDLGYFISKEQEYRIGGKITSSGLSHFSLGTKYSIYESQETGQELLVSLQGRIPLSEPDKLLPYHLQSSSGAFGVISGINYFYSLLGKRLNLILSIYYDYSFKNKFDYQYGDNKSIDLMAFYKLTLDLSFSLSNRLEFRSNDKDNGINKETGGSFSLITPGVHYRFNDFLLSGIFEFPYYVNVSGSQMTNKYSIITNLSWYFKI